MTKLAAVTINYPQSQTPFFSFLLDNMTVEEHSWLPFTTVSRRVSFMSSAPVRLLTCCTYVSNWSQYITYLTATFCFKPDETGFMFNCWSVRLCSIEIDYVWLLKCLITEHSIAFDWQNVWVGSVNFDFLNSIKLSQGIGVRPSFITKHSIDYAGYVRDDINIILCLSSFWNTKVGVFTTQKKSLSIWWSKGDRRIAVQKFCFYFLKHTSIFAYITVCVFFF